MSKQILLIDDDIDILEALQIMLEQAGYTVETTTKASVLMGKRLTKNLPDLILLDVLLSGFDGRCIAKELKKDKKTAVIPLIMMSAHPDADKTCIAAGADAFVAKPFNVHSLLSEIAHYIG